MSIKIGKNKKCFTLTPNDRIRCKFYAKLHKKTIKNFLLMVTFKLRSHTSTRILTKYLYT